MVQGNLTWTLTLGAPLAATVTDVTATAVDEFAFEGTATAAVDPLPVAPSITDPAAVELACSGDAVFTTSVTAGTPAPTITWEQSTDGGDTWAPADGSVSQDGLTLTVAATEDHDGLQVRAVATSTAGTATTEPATLTVSACPTVVMPLAPQVFDPSACGVDQTFETTPVAGVTYVQERDGDIMRFTATADEGYVLAPDVQVVWEFDIVETVDCPVTVTPSAPAATPSNGLAITGGTGAGLLVGIGASLLAAAGLLLASRRFVRSAR